MNQYFSMYNSDWNRVRMMTRGNISKTTFYTSITKISSLFVCVSTSSVMWFYPINALLITGLDFFEYFLFEKFLFPLSLSSFSFLFLFPLSLISFKYVTFCPKALKCVTFCRETLKYGICRECRKNLNIRVKRK